MIDKMIEQIANLPQWAQIFLITLFFLGSGGGILSIIMGYLKSINDSQHKERLEAVENRQIAMQNEQIRAQSEAASAAADRLNTQKLIEVIAAGNERWQRVVDTKSERQLEADKLQHETNKMFIESVKKNTETIANISEMLEIQSEHMGGFGRIMQHFEFKLENTLQTVESTTRENRVDLTTALGMNVTNRVENESNLRSILQSIESLRTDVKYILSQSETQRNQTLSSVDAKFNLIEKRLTEFMNPRPTLLGNPETTSENNRADKPPPDDADKLSA